MNVNTENMTVEITETISTTTQRRAEAGDLAVTAQVTEQKGTPAVLTNIIVSAPDGTTLWSGNATPNISGSFYTDGHEMEVLGVVIAFVTAVRNS